MNCLTGNTFTNYAFYTTSTNITSCYRPELVSCVNVDQQNRNCMQQMYGYMNPSLFNQTSSFMIDVESFIPYIFAGTQSNIALDNIDIFVINGNQTRVHDTHPIKVSLDDGSLLLVDSEMIMSDNMRYDVSYHGDGCNVIYNDRLTDYSQVARILIQCLAQNSSIEYSMNQTMDAANTAIVDHMSVSKIDLIATTATYYPGQILIFKYNVMDKLGNNINYMIIDQMTILLKGNTFLTEINIQDNECPVCDTGILLNDVSLKNNINDMYSLDLLFEHYTLFPEDATITLNVTGCPVGYGPEPNNYTCIPCNNDYCNLSPNNVAECISCVEDGVTCSEGNIFIEQDYWIGFENNDMISSLCPTSYCCVDPNKCNYIDVAQRDNLCSKNRNYTSVLCGKCNDGFSESVNSTQCVKCEQTFYFGYLFIPIVLALLISIFLMVSNTENITNNNHTVTEEVQKQNRFRQILGSDHFKLMLKIMIFKNIFYYEQGLNQILSTSSFKILFISITSIFNLSTIYNTSTNGDNIWCFIDGLNAKQKILLDLLVSVMIVIFIGFTYLTSKYIIQKSVKLRNKKVDFAKTMISAYLLIVGKILDVLFRLLSCQQVGDHSVHFYFGFESCYQSTWILSLITLIIIIASFGSIFIKLKRMSNSERNNEKHALNMITSQYKPSYYYWEAVLFIRRIIIALFSVSIHNSTLLFIFVGIMLLFVFIHHKHEPFIINEANEFEYVLLLCLPFVIMTQIPYYNANAFFINVILSFLIIVPFPLITYYVYDTIKSKLKYFTSNQSHQPISTERSISSNHFDSSQDVDTDDAQLEEILAGTVRLTTIELQRQDTLEISEKTTAAENWRNLE